MTDLDAVATPRPDAHLAGFQDDGAVVFVEDDVTLIRLNATAAVVWQCLDGVSTIGAIVDDLADAYGAPRDEIAADVSVLLDGLLEQGLATLG